MKVPLGSKLSIHQVDLLWLLRDGGVLHRYDEPYHLRKPTAHWIELNGIDYHVNEKVFYKFWKRNLISSECHHEFRYTGMDRFGEYGQGDPAWLTYTPKEERK